MSYVPPAIDVAWARGIPRPMPADRTLSVRGANSEAIWAGLRAVVIGILLIRSAGDPVFNLLGGESGASSMGIGAIFNAAAIAVAAAFLVRRPLTAPFPVIAIWGPFLLIVFGATLRAPELMSAARLAFVLLSYWAFFVFPFFMWRSPDDTSRFILVMMASSVIPSLYAFVDIARGLSDMAEFRLQSTFSHPNIYAFYLVLLIGLGLYIRSSRLVQVTARMRLLITLYMPMLLGFLLLTKTRSAWVTCALIFLIYAIRIDRRFLAGFLLVPVVLFANPVLMERLTDVTEATEVDDLKQLNDSTHLNSYVWRQTLWASAMEPIMERPLLGHGLESFKPSTPSFFPLIGPEGIDGHNFYLQAGYEMGLLGVIALVWLLVSVGRQLAKGWRDDPGGATVALCLLGAYALQCYSDNMHFYLSFNWYFWFAMGTVCAAVRNMREARRLRPLDASARPSGYRPYERPQAHLTW